MFEKFAERENTIFDILQKFRYAELSFIMIGGYAVSAYKHRFSVDADLIIRKQDAEQFERILIQNRFKRTITKDIENVYSPVFMRYELKAELPVHIDLLIDAVAVRQTGASFGFDFLKERSKERKIVGAEKEVLAMVPDKEVLIALKLHSGRLTDFRDAVALCKGVHIDVIRDVANRGKKDVLKKHVEELIHLISEKSFMDSFKGVFVEKKYDIDLECVNQLKTVAD